MKWFNDLTTATKLISSFIFISLILVFAGFYGLSNLNNVKNDMNAMYDDNFIPSILLSVSEVQPLPYSFVGSKETLFFRDWSIGGRFDQNFHV